MNDERVSLEKWTLHSVFLRVVFSEGLGRIFPWNFSNDSWRWWTENRPVRHPKIPHPSKRTIIVFPAKKFKMQFSSPPFHFYFYPFFHLFRFVFLQSNFPENFIKFQSNSWGISICILNGFPLLPVSISIL